MPITLATNLPNITADVTLRGNDADKTIVLAHVDYYHLLVSNDVNARFEGITFQGPEMLQHQGGWSGSVRGNTGSVMTFESCVVKGAGVGYYNGGGVDTAGTLFMTDCEISGNRSQFGDGGGIAAEVLTLIGCTVSRNQGGSQGGGIAARTSATLINCTVTGNVSRDPNSAGGVGSGDTLIMHGTIVSGNYLNDAGQTQAETAVSGAVYNGTGAVEDALGTHNIIGIPGNKTLADLKTIMDAEAADLNGQSYVMGKLQNNGSPTQTVMLAVGSPALDEIPIAAYNGFFTTLTAPGPTTDRAALPAPTHPTPILLISARWKRSGLPVLPSPRPLPGWISGRRTP